MRASKVKQSEHRADGRMMSPPRLRTNEHGFTLVEVLVAIFILLVGVLGVVSLIDGANFATASTKSREGGTNVAREILDGARAVDYDKLTPTEIVGELQAQPGLADSDTAAPGWQIARRGIDYTVTDVPVCKVDDPTDGLGDHADGDFCADPSPTVPPDGNPDDLRRMDVKIAWSVGALNPSVRQTTLIVNPSGSLGPSVKTYCVTGLPASGSTTCPGTPIDEVADGANTKVSFAATTSTAAAFHWQVDDANSRGDATATPSGSSPSWAFDWDLGTVGTFECLTTPNWTLDGNYLVAGQAFDANGIQGQRKALTLTVNRSLPFKTCDLLGGYNDRLPNDDGFIPDKPPIVDFQWKANPERDIVGYEVYRKKVGAEANDSLVCPLTTDTSCYYEPGQLAEGNYEYYVVALDRDPSTGIRRGPSGDPLPVQIGSGNQPPAAPTPVSATTSQGLPMLTWGASPDPDDHEIRFYRIYRDGTAYADRYDRTGGALPLSWTDRNPGAGSHTYYVSAVDEFFDESAPTGPVAP
jgi:prepilin-type N-terminal cleavage/methylation domain-containing protein